MSIATENCHEDNENEWSFGVKYDVLGSSNWLVISFVRYLYVVDRILFFVLDFWAQSKQTDHVFLHLLMKLFFS